MANFQNLPVELQDFVFANIHGYDLLALSATSKVIHAWVIPRAYREISLTDYDCLMLLLRTLKKSESLPKLVTHLELHWKHKSKDAILNLAVRLAAALPRLVNLVHLSVSNALEDICWVFDSLELPSLRRFHAYTYINVAFLQRHPHLHEVTIKDISFWKETETVNLVEPRVIRLLDGGPKELLRLCSDGQPRPTLRRIDWLGRNALHADYEALRRVTSFVTQVNYLDKHVRMAFHLDRPWESIKRVGFRFQLHWSTNCPNQLSLTLNNAVRSFPNMDTLDIYIEQLRTEQEIVARWEQMERVLHATKNLKRVTLNGWSWTRSTATATFGKCAHGQLDDIPDFGVDFPPSK